MAIFDVALKKRFTTGSSALAAGDITAADDYLLIYDLATDTVYKVSFANVSTAVAASLDITEAAQDAVGAMLIDSSSIDLTYTDGSNQATAVVLPGGVNHNALLNYVVNEHIDHSGVTLTAGAGLTGGGTITASRTFDVGAGTGITVNANDVAVDQTFSPTWTNPHTFNSVIVAPGINGATTFQLQIAGTTRYYLAATQDAWGLATTIPSTSTTRYVYGVSGNQGIEIAALNGAPRWVSKRYNGAFATPTKTVSGNSIGIFRTEGYQETTGAFIAFSTIDVAATEDWTSTATGMKVTFRSCVNGSLTQNTTLVLQGQQTQYLAGTVSLPGSTWQGDLTSGWYLIASNNIGLSINATKLVDYSAGTVAVTGNVKLAAAGNGFYIKEGTNACMGVATLVAGAAVVNTTKVTANSRIFLTCQALGTIVVPVARDVTARVAGTSFTITSANVTDTSVIAWEIKEPA